MRFWILATLIAVCFASCTINKNIMFKTDHEYVYDVPNDSMYQEYQLAPNDIIVFQLFTNNGSRLLEVTTSTGDQRGILQFPDYTYNIEADGMVEFPEIGRTEIAGLTIEQAQDKLEGIYSKLYNSPFARINVTNNRVIVFPGAGGNAQVIPLLNRNTTVIESLALAGGLSARGDASQVKLIRRDGEDSEVFLMDLSTIEGIEFANMIVQANDVIYVEPVPEVANEILRDVSPFVSIVSGIALIYAIFRGTF